jgi:hypothetical protein
MPCGPPGVGRRVILLSLAAVQTPSSRQAGRRVAPERARRPDLVHPLRPHPYHHAHQVRRSSHGRMVDPCEANDGRRGCGALRYSRVVREEAPVMSGPEDERAAAVGGRGHLRASRTDRERVIELLKAAFVEERLDKDEFDARVVQALASRTYAELAAVTADIPADLPVVGVATVESATAAPAVGELTSTPARTLAKAAFRACLCVLVAAALVGVAFLTQNPILVLFAVYSVPAAAIAVSGFLGYGVIDAWQERRSRAQLPPGPGQPGGGPGNERNSPVGHGQPPPSTRPDPALQDRTQRDRTRTDLRIGRPQPGRPHPSGRSSRTPRGIQPEAA